MTNVADWAGVDVAYILSAAVRYQLPRTTYGSGIVSEACVALAPLLRPQERAQLAGEIDRALEADCAGQPCDRDAWAMARDALLR